MFTLKKNQKHIEADDESEDKKIIQLYIDTSELAKVGGWELDVNTGTLTWTKITRDIHEVAEDFKPDLQNAINFYKAGENREKINKLVKNAIENGEPFDEELQIITAKGNERWVRAKGKAEFVKNKCIRIYGVFQDINMDKLKDLQHEYSRQLFIQTFDYAPIGIAMVSTDGKLLNINNRICELMGYSEDELLQLSFAHLTHAEDIAKDFELIQQLIDGEINNYEIEKRFIHKDEYVVWVLLSVSVVRNKNLEPLHFIMHFTDISRRKQSEKLLKDERILLETIIDNLPVNIYVKDLRSRKILVNKMEAAYMNAASKKDILGKNDFELFPHESALLSIKEDKEVFDSGIPMIDKETVSRKHDGSETWFLSSKIPFLDGLNEITGLLGISYDITERKKYEQKLKDLTEISEQQNIRLLNFAQMASHNLRSNSANFSKLISLLEEENEINQKDVIGFLKKASLNLADTIKDLIDVTELNENDSNKYRDVNLNQAITKLEDNVKSLVIENRINFINAVDESIFVHVIPAYLNSIILNLITNSIKYKSVNTNPFIQFTSATEDNYLLLSVEDNGIGIDLEKYGNDLFNKHKTFHNNTDAKGIGLYLIKKHVEMMGGKIKVTSQPGAGSIFTVYLPI